jgi:hypothetical protein
MKFLAACHRNDFPCRYGGRALAKSDAFAPRHHADECRRFDKHPMQRMDAVLHDLQCRAEFRTGDD